MDYFRPSKSKGQNFLINPYLIKKLSDFIPDKGDILIEIGPGKGDFSEFLLQKDYNHFYLIELDHILYNYLKERYKEKIASNKVIIKNLDATKLDYYSFGIKNLIVVGNLPYSVGSLIILNIVKHYTYIKEGYFMLQKEVVDKFLLKRNKDKSFLSVILNIFFDVEYLYTISPNNFRPRPKVLSSFFKINRKTNFFQEEIDDFFIFIDRVFKYKRKTIINNLKTYYPKDKLISILNKHGYNEHTRGEDISINDFIKIYEDIKNI